MVRKLSRHASETEHHGHETKPASIGTLPDLPKQTKERQRCSPPPVRLARQCGLTRHRLFRIAAITAPTILRGRRQCTRRGLLAYETDGQGGKRLCATRGSTTRDAVRPGPGVAWRPPSHSVQTDGRAIVLPTALSTGLCNSQTLELGKTQKIGRIHSWWSTTDQWRADRSIVSRRSYERGRYPV
jgi:hypothetical protein